MPFKFWISLFLFAFAFAFTLRSYACITDAEQFRKSTAREFKLKKPLTLDMKNLIRFSRDSLMGADKWKIRIKDASSNCRIGTLKSEYFHEQGPPITLSENTAWELADGSGSKSGFFCHKPLTSEKGPLLHCRLWGTSIQENGTQQVGFVICEREFINGSQVDAESELLTRILSEHACVTANDGKAIGSSPAKKLNGVAN